MISLLRKPFGSHGKVHEISPSSADWRYVGFSLWRLRVGETVSEATGDREVILVMVEGKARLASAGRDSGVLGERMNVFDKTPPHCLYGHQLISGSADLLVVGAYPPGPDRDLMRAGEVGR